MGYKGLKYSGINVHLRGAGEEEEAGRSVAGRRWSREEVEQRGERAESVEITFNYKSPFYISGNLVIDFGRGSMSSDYSICCKRFSVKFNMKRHVSNVYGLSKTCQLEYFLRVRFCNILLRVLWQGAPRVKRRGGEKTFR